MEVKKKIQAKRVDIVSLKVVKESSVLYETRKITNPYDAYKLVKSFLIDSDREKFIVVCLDTKNQPVNKQNDDNQIISNYSGKFIEYYDKEFLYLYDSAMYAEVETFLKGKGQSISVSVNTLLKMLRDKNYIKTEEGQLKPKKLVYDSITKNKERIRLVHLYKKNLNLVNYKEQ